MLTYFVYAFQLNYSSGFSATPTAGLRAIQAILPFARTTVTRHLKKLRDAPMSVPVTLRCGVANDCGGRLL